LGCWVISGRRSGSLVIILLSIWCEFRGFKPCKNIFICAITIYSTDLYYCRCRLKSVCEHVAFCTNNPTAFRTEQLSFGFIVRGNVEWKKSGIIKNLNNNLRNSEINVRCASLCRISQLVLMILLTWRGHCFGASFPLAHWSTYINFHAILVCELRIMYVSVKGAYLLSRFNCINCCWQI